MYFHWFITIYGEFYFLNYNLNIITLPQILWSASILAALGTSLRVICGIGDTPSIVISAAIAMTYTLFGGYKIFNK